MSRAFNIEQVEMNIKKIFPDWNFKVLTYTRSDQPFTIQCLQCNTIKTYQQFSHLSHKKNPCICNSTSSQYKSIQQINELKKFFADSEQFSVIEWTTTKDAKKKPMVHILCNLCGQSFTKRTSIFYNKRECPYCKGKMPLNQGWLEQRVKAKGYTLLSEFTGSFNDVFLRHDKCGYIWRIKPYRFSKELDGDCPNCNNAISKGERRILEFLQEKNIKFFHEYKFLWQSHPLYRYDFFLPDYNLIIEYNGIQHYETTSFLHLSLEENIEHDRIKREEALNNGYNYLVIPYTKYNAIAQILTAWFNDYLDSRVDNKLMIIERDATSFQGVKI